jgi:diguanylate cyclase (GGDEF)-like protein
VTRPEADTDRVKFDLERPTERQLHEGLTCGLIAESIVIPVLVLVTLLDHQSVRWGYIAAAGACIFVSVVYLSMFAALTRGRSSLHTQANLWFAIVCMALTALACIELAAADRLGLYTPAMLIGVVFVCVIGDRRMRIMTDLYAMVLIAWIGWEEGLRGTDLVTSLLIYAFTIGIITMIGSRTVGSLAGDVNVRQAVTGLTEFLDDVELSANSNTDMIREVLGKGLPLVGTVLPVDRAAVFVRNAALDRFVVVMAYPEEDAAACAELATLPQLGEALHTGSVVFADHHCMIPVGYSVDGELVLVLSRERDEIEGDLRTAEAAELVASAFLRATSRANFVYGLQNESRTDPLTGLANRRRLFERIEVEMAHALRADTPLTLAMIDLDHFKVYNDRYGHVAGDTVLRTVAAVMVSNIRGQDMVARYGGEEFCMVLPETDLVGAHYLLDGLRCGGRDSVSDFGVTLSVGLTSWDGLEDTTSLIERADQALYRAKEMGRNRVVSIQAYTEF